MIRNLIEISLALAATGLAQAQPLRFTSGVVSTNWSTVTLTLHGGSEAEAGLEQSRVGQ